MLDQTTIDNYLKGLRIRLQEVKEIQNKLQDPTGQLSKQEADHIINLRDQKIKAIGFLLCELYINGIEQIDLGETK